MAAADAAASESADIDRIIKEKKDGSSLLVAWLDGAPPQWVARADLQGTVALEEWDEADDDVPEEFDPPETVAAKVSTLVTWLRASKRPTWLAGAGLSAPVLPTFRGSGGLWTRSAPVRQPAPCRKKARGCDAARVAGVVAGKRGDGLPQPTLAHRALVALERAGRVGFLASQNYDNRESGEVWRRVE